MVMSTIFRAADLDAQVNFMARSLAYQVCLAYPPQVLVSSLGLEFEVLLCVSKFEVRPSSHTPISVCKEDKPDRFDIMQWLGR